MPRLVAIQPAAVVGVDLGHMAWRLNLGVTKVGEEWALTLVYRYPPAQAFLAAAQGTIPLDGTAVVALVRAAIPFAQDAASVQQVASVALGQGTLDGDLARVREAMLLFQNDPRASRAAVEASASAVQEVIHAWWWVREAIVQGERKQQAFGGDQLVFLP